MNATAADLIERVLPPSTRGRSRPSEASAPAARRPSAPRRSTTSWAGRSTSWSAIAPPRPAGQACSTPWSPWWRRNPPHRARSPPRLHARGAGPA